MLHVFISPFPPAFLSSSNTKPVSSNFRPNISTQTHDSASWKLQCCRYVSHLHVNTTSKKSSKRISRPCLVNKPTWCTIYSQYIYHSLHVSVDHVTIIRRNNCVFATLCICYSVWLAVSYAGWNEFHPTYQNTQNNKYQVSQKHSSFS